MDSINIVFQAPAPCRGLHVDPEYTLIRDTWQRTDANYKGGIVETIHRQAGETDEAFFGRVCNRAAQLDRVYRCSRCYEELF